jgi:protein-L-isoaspartate O-methyltransferase
MMEHTATYSPEDNKLRLYPAGRLDADTYARAKAHGFKWAPKQGLFVAGMWTPAREDFLMELAGEIGDEDTSLVERQAERAERFEGYQENRARDADSAQKAVRQIADNIPFGQPILVGHHSERHARRDAAKIENGMRRAVKMWETASYWEERARGALRHAKYKERPDVRARRIKGIESDRRKQAKIISQSEMLLKLWADPVARLKKKSGEAATLREAVIYLADADGGYYLAEHKRASGYVGPLSLWEAAGGNIDEADPEAVAVATPEEVCAKAIANHKGRISWAKRWLGHYDNRLTYERAMMAESGGTAADKTKPEKGGAVRSLWGPRDGWAYIVKVNQVTVTIHHQWSAGGRVFKHNEPLDKLREVMTAAQVAELRAAGRIVEDQSGCGFWISGDPRATETEDERRDRVHREHLAAIDKEQGQKGEEFRAMQESLKAGVVTVAVPQLFPTPAELAARMVELAAPEVGMRVLEPSAGTGKLLEALPGVLPPGFQSQRQTALHVVAVELNRTLAEKLQGSGLAHEVHAGDFLELAAAGTLGTFDRIVMNPPFEGGADIRHIVAARRLLRPGGRLVAICANGPRQNRDLSATAEHWEELPADTFKAQGTGVRACLLVMTDDRPPAELVSPTPEDLRHRDAELKQAQERARMAEAAPPAGELRLTGSDRDADVASACGQRPLF